MKNKTLFAISALILLFPALFNSKTVFAQNMETSEERLEAVVEKIIEEKEVDIAGSSSQPGSAKKQLYQKLEMFVTQGSMKNQKIIAESGNFPMVFIPRYKAGDKLVVNASKDIRGNNFFQIVEYVRRDSLYWLLGIFIALTLVVGKLKGFTSLIGLAFSFLIIFKFVLPQILSGKDPVLVSIIASLFIIPVSFYLSHGFNRKTTIAIFGTIIALIVTGILANFFVEAAHLTGFVSEESGFLQFAKQGVVNIKGLLLAGIIIGALGVLDDVTVSQAAVVEQLNYVNEKLGKLDLYNRAMSVGMDHIASMVNTLVLVYTGASMPLLLLFINSPMSFSAVINYEIIANEVIRTLVGSIGLILAVPITTFIAAIFARKGLESVKEDKKALRFYKKTQ